MGKRIVELADRSVASDDYLEIDGLTNGTARVPIGRAGGAAVLDANGMPVTAAGVPVVESGSNTNGSYVILADGTLICYHTLAITGLSIATAVGAWYRNGGGTIVWTYPMAFTAMPAVNVGLLEGNTLDITAGPLSSTSDKTSASVLLLASQSHTGVDVTLLLTAIGRWS